MATSHLRDASPLAYSHLHGPSITISTPPYHTDGAAENRVCGTVCAETRVAAPQDTSTFYETYLDTKLPLLADQDNFEPDNESHPCDSPAAAAHDASIDDAQLEARGHTAAYKLAVRLANRSNGAPLATIIEQGSYSTLNSHGSLLSVGRFPSIKTAESASPNRGSRRRSRSLDEKALHDIQEDLARELDATAVAVPPAGLEEEHGAATPASGTATPLASYRFELRQSPSSLFGDDLYENDTRGVKGFIRGVLQNVRGASRTRSRSASMTHAPTMDHRESPPSTCESRPQVDQQYQEPDMLHPSFHSRDVLTHVSESVVMASVPRQPGNRATSSLGTDLSARADLPITASRILASESTALFGSLPLTLPCRTTTRSLERPFSTPVVHAGTRDVAQGNSTIQASTSHHDMFDTLARYTFDGVPAYREQPTSTRQASSARDVFTSQNASFCSTMTSSYSGTVLGVDIDLQQGSSYSIRRSQSPPSPVWFTPQMSELERQASCPDSPQHLEAILPSSARSRSVTSSALTSLLPIAAASGIVRPNYNTPKISLYSPSGNLIQPESSSPQGASPSERNDPPTVASSNCYMHSADAVSSSGSLPIRPPLLSMITPPTHKTPLPSHLRYHHNYGRPEMSQVGSHESIVTPKGPVKGCDGVVRENSLTPRSGVFFPHGKDTVHRSARLAVHDLKTEMKFYKARFLTLVAAHSFAPSISKGETLQKRHIHVYNAYARQPHPHEEESRKGGYLQDVLGPLTAHALRVCFCQPYDGAGRPTRATAAGACMTGEPSSKSGRPKDNRHRKDTDRLLPNARLVSSERRSEGRNTKRAARRDSVVGVTTGRVSNTIKTRRNTD